MVVQKQIRAFGMGAVAVSLLVLTGCSNSNKNLAQMSSLERQIVSKKEVAVKLREIADLNTEKKVEERKTQVAQKQLAVLLSQSDDAFRLAGQYRKLASQERNADKKKQLEQTAVKAQAAADMKSGQLVEKHAHLYDIADRIHSINAEISQVVAQKKRAEQIAANPSKPIDQKM